MQKDDEESDFCWRSSKWRDRLGNLWRNRSRKTAMSIDNPLRLLAKYSSGSTRSIRNIITCDENIFLLTSVGQM